MITLSKEHAQWLYSFLVGFTARLNPKESAPLFWLMELLRNALEIEVRRGNEHKF